MRLSDKKKDNNRRVKSSSIVGNVHLGHQTQEHRSYLVIDVVVPPALTCHDTHRVLSVSSLPTMCQPAYHTYPTLPVLHTSPLFFISSKVCWCTGLGGTLQARRPTKTLLQTARYMIGAAGAPTGKGCPPSPSSSQPTTLRSSNVPGIPTCGYLLPAAQV